MGRLHKIAIASVASAALMIPFAGTAAAQPSGGIGGDLNLGAGSLDLGAGADLGAFFGFGGGGGMGDLNLDLAFPGIDFNVEGNAGADFAAWVEREWQLWLEANFGGQGGTGNGGAQANFDFQAEWDRFWAQAQADWEAFLAAQGGGGVNVEFQGPQFPEFNFDLGAGGGFNLGDFGLGGGVDGGLNVGDLLGLNLGGGANFGS
ncbi:hypothetical protein [Hoyosella altamirensis]|uniref:Uncharacterized protein n=1 Tax=Hoyosella altamirensis TaxID=616997 RepID=A0A839RNJ5_9ACTN|nr:hypothetical protein [Hoyosella altamirensis]MBB3038345.1 hypothetical protein [Hoyosella altamirensis]